MALDRFGLIPFRSPLLRESMFLSVPPVTEMCHFTGLPSSALCVQAGIRAHYHAWVPPFGDPRVKGCSARHRFCDSPTALRHGHVVPTTPIELGPQAWHLIGLG